MTFQELSIGITIIGICIFYRGQFFPFHGKNDFFHDFTSYEFSHDFSNGDPNR